MSQGIKSLEYRICHKRYIYIYIYIYIYTNNIHSYIYTLIIYTNKKMEYVTGDQVSRRWNMSQKKMEYVTKEYVTKEQVA